MKLASVLCVSSALVGLSSALSLSTRVADVNPFAGHNFFVSPVYAKEIAGAIVNLLKRGELSLAAKALKVAQGIVRPLLIVFFLAKDTYQCPPLSGFRTVQACRLSQVRHVPFDNSCLILSVSITIFRLPQRSKPARAYRQASRYLFTRPHCSKGKFQPVCPSQLFSSSYTTFPTGTYSLHLPLFTN